MTRGRPVTLRLTAALAIALAIAGGSVAGSGLTHGALLARAYDAILDGRPDRFDAEYRQACGPAPAEACKLLQAVGLWWQIQQDFFSRRHDDRFLALANDAIASAEAWTRREPRRAEAWFYLGGAYGVRLQWRGLRGSLLAAARDGKRVKDALERAVALDPQLNDAYFGIGLYHYYADIMPSVLKVLRWLLLLPGGDREEGLAEMLRTRDRGEVMVGEADFQLHQIYIWYENQPGKAIDLLGGLATRYPHNPMFIRMRAEILDVYRHDAPASRDAYRELASKADRGELGFAAIASVDGRLGMARQLVALEEADRAIALLTPLAASRPTAPYGALAQVQLQLGRAHDSLGARQAALAAYRAAIAAAPPDDPAGVQSQARTGLSRAPASRAAEARRLSIEGWRAFERSAPEEAAASLRRALELNPANPVARLRHATLLAAQGDSRGALAGFERVIAQRPAAPGFALGAARYEAGRLLAASGDRARALDLFRAASSTQGAESRTREAAREAARSIPAIK